MRRAITLARKHGEQNFSVLIGPEVHINAHTAAFKESINDPRHDFAEIEVWTSSAGRVKGKKFHPPTVAPEELVVLSEEMLKAEPLEKLQDMALELDIEVDGIENDRAKLITAILGVVALQDLLNRGSKAATPADVVSTPAPELGIFPAAVTPESNAAAAGTTGQL